MALFNALLSEVLWSRNSCHSACSALGLVEVGWRRTDGLPLLLQARHGGIWGGEAGA
jgi:hypothetical protein